MALSFCEKGANGASVLYLKNRAQEGIKNHSEECGKRSDENDGKTLNSKWQNKK